MIRSLIAILILTLCLPAYAADMTSMLPKKLQPKKETPEQLRADYISRLQEQNQPAPDQRTPGSLWQPGASLGELSSDYKARSLNDVVVIEVAVQTTAAQSGSLNSQRQFSATSGITGLTGDIATKGLNPLFNANSNSALKGSGQTASNTTFQTALTGHVISVLPNGFLVVEAEREIYMNNQHENIVVRGVVRPDDISSVNTIPSTALANLEIEMKGKGIIADSTRPPNPLTRAVLWLFGF